MEEGKLFQKTTLQHVNNVNTVGHTEKLQREIGVRSLALAIINITVGSGIFVIPAIIAEGLGATAILAYFVCGTLIFSIALCFAYIGSKTKNSGGVYTYIENAFGPYAGFLANNVYWMGGCIFSDAAIANALADTLKTFFPFLENNLYRGFFLFSVFGILALLNIRSLRKAVRFIEITSLAKFIPLLVLIVVGTGFVSPNNLQWVSLPTASSIAAASLLLFFAFLGLEGPLSNGGEIKNPNRTVPLGIFWGVAGVLVLYIAIQLVTQGVLGSTIAAHKNAPLAAVSLIAFGKWGPILIIIITAVAMLGTLAGDILCVPRILFAGARDGLLPKPLAKVHPHFVTPYIAIGFYAAAGFLLAISGGFKQLATIASASILLIYLAVTLATIKRLLKPEPATEKTFEIPGGLIIPLVATAGIVWLLSSLSKPEWAGISIFVAVCSIVFFIKKYFDQKKSKGGYHLLKSNK